MQQLGREAMGNLGQYAGQAAGSGRTMGELVADVITNIQDIMRSEVRLARTEVREEVTKAAGASKMLVAGGLIGLFAVAFALVTVFCALLLVVQPWLAGLIVTAALGLSAGAALAMGVKRWKQFHAAPEKTIATVKENVEWARNQIKS